MANIAKKRQNLFEDRSLSSSVVDNQTVEELQARNAELERKLRKYKSMSWPLTRARFWLCIAETQQTTGTRTTIKAIIRPKGEAGSHKRGFILYDAMEMGKVENGAVVYDRMRVSDL